jgi:two-component system, sensor histidine kinase PdtaS
MPAPRYNIGMPARAAPLHDVSAMSALREIAQALSAAWDLDTTLERIAHGTNRVMQVDSCSIYLLEPDGETLRLRASTRLARDALGLASLHLGEGITGWAAQHGQPAAVRDAKADPRFKLLPETNEETLKSLLAVPLVNQGRMIGAMNVQTAVFHDFSAAEADLLALIGDLAAGALDRAMLYDRMNRKLEELTTLAKVSETVTAPMYNDEILELVVEMAANVMGVEVCSLQLIDEAKDELVMRAAWSRSQAYRSRPPLRLGEGIVGQVIRERRPVTVMDVREDPRYRFREMARQEGLVSMLSVPLIVREKVIGVMNCYTAAPSEFPPERVALLSTLANQTALAIENARLVTNAAVVREMHHRIKNNLQTVAMLLGMQARESRGLRAEDVLHASANRILSIAAVHEILAQEGFRLVNVKQVAERIVRLTAQNMVRPDLHVEITVEGESVVLPSRPATSLALVINELLQNSLEHAFVGREQGSVRILLGHSPAGLVVEVADDGIGFTGPEANSLGLEIVDTLIHEDLHGTLETHGGTGGTRVTLRIPSIDKTQEVE